MLSAIVLSFITAIGQADPGEPAAVSGQKKPLSPGSEWSIITEYGPATSYTDDTLKLPIRLEESLALGFRTSSIGYDREGGVGLGLQLTFGSYSWYVQAAQSDLIFQQGTIARASCVFRAFFSTRVRQISPFFRVGSGIIFRQPDGGEPDEGLDIGLDLRADVGARITLFQIADRNKVLLNISIGYRPMWLEGYSKTDGFGKLSAIRMGAEVALLRE